jgi:hypothetical protein
MGRKTSVTVVTREAESGKEGEQYKISKLYADCFSSEAGKFVLKDMKRKFHFVTSTFISGDSHATSYQEGQRSVVLDILMELTKSEHPEIFETPDTEEIQIF